MTEMKTSTDREFEEQRRQAVRHQKMLENLRAILATTTGREFFLYLFEEFEIGQLPEVGYPAELLGDKLGFLRAGNSIFEIVAEADDKVAGDLLAKKTKALREKLYLQSQNEQG